MGTLTLRYFVSDDELDGILDGFAAADITSFETLGTIGSRITFSNGFGVELTEAAVGDELVVDGYRLFGPDGPLIEIGGFVSALEGDLFYDEIAIIYDTGDQEVIGLDFLEDLPAAPIVLDADDAEAPLFVDFGDGQDTLSLDFLRGEFGERVDEDGRVEIVTPAGTFRLADIERIALADGVYLYDVEGELRDFVYRTYEAAFGRTPDEDGFLFWNGVANTGVAATAIAEDFVQSGEFADLFGTDPSTAEFIDALYQNVLGRDADQAGFEFWSGVLDGAEFSRADMLVFFAESGENISQTAEDLDDGIWVV